MLEAKIFASVKISCDFRNITENKKSNDNKQDNTRQ